MYTVTSLENGDSFVLPSPSFSRLAVLAGTARPNAEQGNGLRPHPKFAKTSAIKSW